MHRRKAESMFADDTAMGSTAFTGLARAVWHLSSDPDDPARRLLVPGKCNQSAQPTGMAFTIEGDPVRLEWDPDPVDMTADDALSRERVGGGGRLAAKKEIGAESKQDNVGELWKWFLPPDDAPQAANSYIGGLG